MHTIYHKELQEQACICDKKTIQNQKLKDNNYIKRKIL